MYVTQHAAERINARLSLSDAHDTLTFLEGVQGETGVVAYIVGTVPAYGSKPDGSTPGWWVDSNGDTIVAVAHDGSVETVFYRRSSQDMSASFFGARKVVDMRMVPLA